MGQGGAHIPQKSGLSSCPPPPGHRRPPGSIRTGQPHVAAERHERSCPLWRRHRHIPPIPHGGLPATRHVIIGDFNAAPSMDDRGGRQTPEDTAVQMAMQPMGLQDLTASLQGQPSHRPPQPGSTDSRIDLCYADPAHVEVQRARYHDQPSQITGHRPLEVQIRVLQVPPASTEDVDHDGQPLIRPPDEHYTHSWMA